MSDWPRYESHKIVQARRIVGFFNTPDTGGRVCGIVEGGERFAPIQNVMLEAANVGDYAVIYEDGYKSISPAKAFEEGYRKVEGSDFPG
jgi:hypothetical protein